MKRLHIYISDAQYSALKSYAKQQDLSMSRALRGLVPIGGETIRDYSPDGQHTKPMLEQAKVSAILSRLR